MVVKRGNSRKIKSIIKKNNSILILLIVLVVLFIGIAIRLSIAPTVGKAYTTVTSEKGYITGRIDLPAKINVGEEFTVNIQLDISNEINEDPFVGIVVDPGLEIKKADFCQYEGDTIACLSVPDYNNINFTVSAAEPGDYNISSSWAIFALEDKGSFSGILTVFEKDVLDIVDTNELLIAINDWIAGKLKTTTILQAINKWIG